MAEKRINELTNALRARESWLSYYVWQTGKNYGVELSQRQIEDIIGDAYLKAATKLRNDSSLDVNHYLAWFVRILFLTAMNAIRKRGPLNAAVDLEEIRNLNENNFVYELFDRNYYDPFFKRQLERSLSTQEFEILRLTVEGYSSNEIAGSLNLSGDNVRQIKHRAIKKIKKLFNSHENP